MCQSVGYINYKEDSDKRGKYKYDSNTGWVKILKCGVAP